MHSAAIRDDWCRLRGRHARPEHPSVQSKSRRTPSTRPRSRTGRSWPWTSRPGSFHKGPRATLAPGAPGQQGPQGVLSESVVAGPVGTALGGGTAFVFVGETQRLTLGAGQSIVGVATGQVRLLTGSGPQEYGFTLCYRVGAGPVTRFLSNANDFQVAGATNVTQSNTAAAAVSLPAGTYTVGYCVFNPNPISLSGDWAMGTFQVVNGAVTYNPANGPSTPVGKLN